MPDHSPADAMSPTLETSIAKAFDQEGISLAERSHRHPVLVVFLRHSGCPLCKQTLSALQAATPQLRKDGIHVFVVHMDSDDNAKLLLNRFQLGWASRYSDPEAKLYQEFGLSEGTLGQLFGPSALSKYMAALAQGYLPGLPVGNTKMMAGSFLLHQSRIVYSAPEAFSGDMPDYGRMICPIP